MRQIRVQQPAATLWLPTESSTRSRQYAKPNQGRSTLLLFRQSSAQVNFAYLDRSGTIAVSRNPPNHRLRSIEELEPVTTPCRRDYRQGPAPGRSSHFGARLHRWVRLLAVAFLDLELASASTPGPTHRSYWVVEGRFVAGAYPSREEPPEFGEMPDVTAALLDVGIDCFVNLTEDHPGGRERFRFHRYHDYVADSAVVLVHPIVDVDTPTIDEMVATLDAIDGHLRAGGNVYAHCWGGKGRTGTVVGCWLVRHRYASPEGAEDELDRLREGDIGAGDQPSPDTVAQRAFIRSWKPGL